MKLSRRKALEAAAAMVASSSLTSCESIYSEVSRNLGAKIPERVVVPVGESIDPYFHFLSRAAYGPWIGDTQKLRELGFEKWLDEQLEPQKIKDFACAVRARRFETVHLSEGACFDFKRESLRRDIMRHTLLRAIYSQRQVQEVMVGFWTDHLNISLDKGNCIYYKAADDRKVIRQNALKHFKPMILSSAKSPAMLEYLDGKENKIKPGSVPNVPNENYARELLELHTLGVHGGYSQKDVYELARCLTGWTLPGESQRGKVKFDSGLHDSGEKHLLGKTIKAGGGEKDLAAAVDIIFAHPSCSKYVAGKIAAHFMSQPSAELLDAAAASFRKHPDGDIASTLKTILLSPEFMADRATKIKRPFNFLVSLLRSLGADTHAHDDLLEYLQRMGQMPFQYPTPDGYPEDPNFWMGTLLWRWKFALACCAGEIESVSLNFDSIFEALAYDDSLAGVSKCFAHFVGRSPSQSEISALSGFKSEKKVKRTDLVSLVLSSPAFQRY